MAPTESKGYFDRKSQLVKFNGKANAQINWAKDAIKSVETVEESEIKSREQQVAELLEMGVEVSAWNTDQKLAIDKKRESLMSSWQQFAAKHRQWQVEGELEPGMSHLSNRLRFLATVVRENQLVTTLREEFLKKPPTGSGLSQLILSQFEHEKTRTTLTLKNRLDGLSKLRKALVETCQWSAEDQEIFEGMHKNAREVDDCALRQLHWIKVLFNNQAFFRRAKILLKRMAETLEGSITGKKGQRKYCDDLSDEFKAFIVLWDMARMQLSRNVHWRPEKKQKMVDCTHKMSNTMEEMLAKLDTMSGAQRKQCVSNFFKDLSMEKMAITARKEVLELLGKYFEIPEEYKEGNGPLLPWDDFVLVCDTGFGEVTLGDESPPKKTGNVWTDQFMATWHLVLRKLIEEKTWIEESCLELQRANDENNVESVKRLLHEVDLKNATIRELKPVLIIFAPLVALQAIEHFVKNHIDDRWSDLWQTLAIFKNMCVALLERLEEDQGTMQA